MKTVVFLLILSLFSILYAQVYEDIFAINWGNGSEELGLNVLNLGNVSHERGYFALRYGPEAIVVWQDKEIIILDKVHNRILIFNTKGKVLESHIAPETACGLAVGDDGSIVAFSSFDKIVWGIRGRFANKTFHTPSSFGALSEVWFAKEELWGRYGVESARLDATESRSNIAVARGVCIGHNKIEVSLSNSRDTAIVSLEGSLCDAYASGQILDGGKIAVTLVRPDNARERSHEVMLCDQNGALTEPVTLSMPWTQCFSSYTVTPNGVVYEMVIQKSGVTIRKWQASKLDKNTDIQSEKGVLPENQQTLKEMSGNSERATVNVWFRSSNVVKTMDLDTYLHGVVSQEIYSWWELQAHKSMAVGARTYAVARKRHADKNAHVCDTTCCQAWTSNPNPRSIQAVNETSGEYVMRSGSRVTEPLYYSHCNGHTRNSEDYDSWSYVAYLRSQPCICGYTSYFGHGVGMCQYGMQSYALKGYTYGQIIQHYYQGCSVGK